MTISMNISTSVYGANDLSGLEYHTRCGRIFSSALDKKYTTRIRSTHIGRETALNSGAIFSLRFSEGGNGFLTLQLASGLFLRWREDAISERL